MARGTVKWFNQMRGMGYITWINEEEHTHDIIFYTKYIENKTRTLYEGDRVEFDVSSDRRGPMAINVKNFDPE